MLFVLKDTCAITTVYIQVAVIWQSWGTYPRVTKWPMVECLYTGYVPNGCDISCLSHMDPWSPSVCTVYLGQQANEPSQPQNTPSWLGAVHCSYILMQECMVMCDGGTQSCCGCSHLILCLSAVFACIIPTLFLSLSIPSIYLFMHFWNNFNTEEQKLFFFFLHTTHFIILIILYIALLYV